MKLPDLGSTSAPDGDADLGPGKGQADDAAKDAAALAATNVRELAPAAASESDAQAAADLDEAIASGRRACTACGGTGAVVLALDGSIGDCNACDPQGVLTATRPGPLATDEEP